MSGKIFRTLLGAKERSEVRAPNIDDAAKNRDEFDRIRRRRGVLANIFSKASDSPAVGKTQLGQ